MRKKNTKSVVLSCIFLVILFCVGAGAGFVANAQEEKAYTFGPAPSWVEMYDAKNDLHKEGEILYGIEYLLQDIQVNELGAQPEEYFRDQSKVVDTVGIEEASHISIYYNPGFQKLIIHNIHIHRGSHIIDASQDSKIHVLQREEELEDYVLDGEKTVNITLSSVRVGDIVDYSYTIIGRSPTFVNRIYNRFSIGYAVSIKKTKIRILLPKDRDVNVRQYHLDAPYAEVMKSDWKELVWDIDDVPAVYDEGDLPAWYSPYARIWVSEYASWDELKAEIKEMFYREQDLSDEIRELVKTIQSETATKEEQIIKALRFVQNQISYTSLSIENGGYVPKKPSKVMAERYGDCKDTSLFLVTLLNELGIEAYPAFVNTYLNEHLEDYLPCPWMFDHVIVLVKHNYHSYWLDPTSSSEEGTLESTYQSLYGKALVLDDSSGLTMAEIVPLQAPRMSIKTTLDFQEQLQGEVLFTVETLLRSDYADYQRGRLRREGFKKIEKESINLLAQRFPQIRSLKKMEIQDDEEKDEMIFREYYGIRDIWNADGNEGHIRIYPAETYSRLPDPDNVIRDMPLAIDYPAYITEEYEIKLPRRWKVKNQHLGIKDKSFIFTKDVLTKGRTIKVAYSFKTFQDHVLPENCYQFFQHLDQVDKNDTLWLNLSQRDWRISLRDLRWKSICIVSLVMLVMGFVLWLYSHRIPPSVNAVVDYPRLVGLKGWLIVFIVRLCLSFFSFLFIVYSYQFLFSVSSWQDLTTPGAYYYRWAWKPFAYSFFVGIPGGFVYSLFLLVQIFQKKRNFPFLATVFYFWNLLFLFLLNILWLVLYFKYLNLTKVLFFSTNFLLSLCEIIAFLVYFNVSKRVKATFVNER